MYQQVAPIEIDVKKQGKKKTQKQTLFAVSKQPYVILHLCLFP